MPGIRGTFKYSTIRQSFNYSVEMSFFVSLIFFFQAIDGKQISSALEIYDQDNIYMKTRNPFKEMTIRFSLSTTTMKFASQYSDFYKSDRGIIGIFNQNLYQSVSHSKSLFWLYIGDQIDTHMAYRINDTGKKKDKQGIIILKKIERKNVSKDDFCWRMIQYCLTKRVRNCNWTLWNKIKYPQQVKSSR